MWVIISHWRIWTNRFVQFNDAWKLIWRYGFLTQSEKGRQLLSTAKPCGEENPPFSSFSFRFDFHFLCSPQAKTLRTFIKIMEMEITFISVSSTSRGEKKETRRTTKRSTFSGNPGGIKTNDSQTILFPIFELKSFNKTMFVHTPKESRFAQQLCFSVYIQGT